MKLELCCITDKTRPAMGYVKITKETMVATNAHILGVLPTELLFDEEQIEQIPEEGFLLLASDFKKLREAHRRAFSTSLDTIHLWNKKEALSIIPTATEANVGKYPNWQGVIPPPEMRTASLPQISLNAALLANLQLALTSHMGKPQLTLAFSGPSKAIYCEPAYDLDEESCANRHFGIIMPVYKNS
jgi:hypothetical protein